MVFQQMRNRKGSKGAACQLNEMLQETKYEI